MHWFMQHLCKLLSCLDKTPIVGFPTQEPKSLYCETLKSLNIKELTEDCFGYPSQLVALNTIHFLAVSSAVSNFPPSFLFPTLFPCTDSHCSHLFILCLKLCSCSRRLPDKIILIQTLLFDFQITNLPSSSADHDTQLKATERLIGLCHVESCLT